MPHAMGGGRGDVEAGEARRRRARSHGHVRCGVCGGARDEGRKDRSWLAALGVGGQIFYTGENRPSNRSRRMFWPYSIFQRTPKHPRPLPSARGDNRREPGFDRDTDGDWCTGPSRPNSNSDHRTNTAVGARRKHPREGRISSIVNWGSHEQETPHGRGAQRRVVRPRPRSNHAIVPWTRSRRTETPPRAHTRTPHARVPASSRFIFLPGPNPRLTARPSPHPFDPTGRISPGDR